MQRDKTLDKVNKNAIKKILSNKIIVGIDLGTTNSCIAIYKPKIDGSYHKDVLVNHEGNTLTRSMVTIKPRDKVPLVGRASLIVKDRFPKETFYDAKRIIGKTFQELRKSTDISLWPFTILEDE